MLDERDLRAGPFHVRRVAWSAASAQPIHVHRETRIVIPLYGDFWEKHRGVTRELSRGDAIVRAAEERHSDAYAADGGHYVRIAIADSAIAENIVRGTHECVRSAAILELGSRVAQEILQSDPWSSLAVQGLIFELIAEIGRDASTVSPHSPRWIAEVRELLRDDHETMWTLADIGRRVGVEPATLGRTFRKHVGVGVGEELRRARVFHARRLIEHSQKSLAEIATEVGFADQSHLTRSTRRVLGITPGTLRRRKARTPIETTQR